jgi:hypothetical protein
MAVFFVLTVVPGYGQVKADEAQNTQAGRQEEKRLADIKDRYAKADYAACKSAIESALLDNENKKLTFAFYELTELYVYDALVVYAFRAEGFQKEVQTLLRKAIELDINYDFKDYAVIPTYILDQFIKLKKEYIAGFAKSSRRHCIGLFTVISYLPVFLTTPEYLKLGVHYSYNLSDSFALLFDLEFPLSSQIFNDLQFRTGAVWFPSFKIETISMGLGLHYALRMENFSAFTNVFSIEGYGEFIFRFGLGIAASVELLRLAIIAGAGSFPSGGLVNIYSSSQVSFSFANLRIYVFYTF